MKKTLSLAVVALLAAVFSINAYSQAFKFGVKAGMDFTNMSGFSEMKDKGFLKTYTGFHVGGLMSINLPLGFEVQPELLYVQQGVNTENATIQGGSLRLPVNIQWGISLFDIVKPYVFVSPFIGYGLFQDGVFIGAEEWNKFQYGVGLGLGVNVWKFQVAFKWNWDLNKSFSSDLEGIVDDLKAAKFNGGSLSLAYIF